MSVIHLRSSPIPLLRRLQVPSPEMVRGWLVKGCAVVLIAAGPFLPF